MKRISSGILLAVALAMPAMAADIAAKAPIYKAAPRVLAYNWTGFYVGAHAGYGWGTADIDISNFGANWCVPCQGTLIANGTPSLRVDGYVVGGQAGFNQQVGQWVFGVEADLASARLKGSRTTGVITSPGLQPVSFAERVEADWIFTLRPRIGFAFDSVLVYATGGLAVAHYEFSQILTFIPPSTNGGTTSGTKAGWTIGGGFEYALGEAWSLKAEYFYADFGKLSFRANNSVFTNLDNNLTHTSSLTENIVRVGVNYRFGGPVVARN
jgi:outer membrane immunogenic protein